MCPFVEGNAHKGAQESGIHMRVSEQTSAREELLHVRFVWHMACRLTENSVVQRESLTYSKHHLVLIDYSIVRLVGHVDIRAHCDPTAHLIGHSIERVCSISLSSCDGEGSSSPPRSKRISSRLMRRFYSSCRTPRRDPGGRVGTLST